MRAWAIVAAIVVVTAAIGGYLGGVARADVRLQDCGDWVDQTNDRVQYARTLLYPPDRPDAFEGTLAEAAEELYILYEEQLESEAPDGAQQLSDDLSEAMVVGAEGLAAGDAAAETQIVFAKSIIYNADARLLAVVETC
jgi:hypothetical protein